MSEPSRQDGCSSVLHALRCIGVAGVDRVSAASGLPSQEAEECLLRLRLDGLATLSPGPFGGWSLTDHGRAVDDAWLRRQLEATDSREHVRRGYARFLDLNPELLRICGDWQMHRTGGAVVLNDHSDAEYDLTVLSRLVRIDEGAQVICTDLAERIAHFGVYRGRLSFALARALAGDHGFVADRLDSYHTIWFQLHEDLLTTLGISREDERGT